MKEEEVVLISILTNYKKMNKKKKQITPKERQRCYKINVRRNVFGCIVFFLL